MPKYKQSKAIIEKIIHQDILLDDLSDDDLAAFCQAANLAYRSGKPIISDQDYDFVYLPELKNRIPQHPLFQSVEPEGQGFSEKKIRLPEVMLSTDKAYSWHEIEKWLQRIKKSADELNLAYQAIQIKATPKLDGFAGYDDGTHLYTRGDGKKGSDISRVFERGLSIFILHQEALLPDVISGRGQGAGEIVVKKSYFESHLSKSFESPRNFQASLIREKSLDANAQQAIDKKAALFVPFVQLPAWIGNINTLTLEFEKIVSKMLEAVDFEVDGVVFELSNPDLKTQMGANRKFHRWQIAFKENIDIAQVRVISVTPQVGRTGKITPVAELKPTLLSGATIMRATGHHYGLVKTQGLGAGSVIELTRSGSVIPKINKVLKSAQIDIPTICPSCGTELQWEADFLMCLNQALCPAQIIGKMVYFFKILANNDGFGLKTIEKLYANGINKISQIYALTQSDLMAMDFGDKTSVNLINQLKRSRTEQIEDWRFLAAFSVVRLGLGNGENLLKSYPLNAIFELDLVKIANIDGFADLTAQMIVDGLIGIKNEFKLLNQYGFNLQNTALNQEFKTLSHGLVGKKIVFTGKMSRSRAAVKKHAKSVGIHVVTGISAKTDYLVIGENVGEKKIQNAEKFGVSLLSEADYLSMLA